MAQHVMGLGSSEPVTSDTPLPTQPNQSSNPDIQQEPTEIFTQSESPCLASRATAIRVQGFSDQVAEQIEIPQTPQQATKQSGSFLFDGASLIRWTLRHHL